jgi:hypothetical protein
MKAKILLSWVVCLLWSNANGHADFRYSESAKVTGGMMASMMKVMGAFSEGIAQASGPMQSSTYVKGNRLRKEEPTGKVEIVDLDKQWVILIDPASRTYSMFTLDEMRTGLRQAHETARQNAGATVPMIPKVEIRPMAATKTILNHTSREVKIRTNIEMQSEDRQGKAQTTLFWFTSDAWVASTVRGYDEVSNFYEAMSHHLDWLPGQMFSGAGGVSPVMEEFRKLIARMKGFPLVQSSSFGALEQGGRIGSQSAHVGPSNGESFLDMTIEVTSFSNSPLNENLFQVPAGYTQMEQGARDMVGGRR